MSNFKSPMIRNQKMSISLAVLRRFEWAKHQNGPFQPPLHWYRPASKAIRFKSDFTMRNSMSNFKSPMIRNQKMSISLAVLRRFEWAKHQNGPFQPRLHWYHQAWKQFASNRTLQCVTACPILSPQWSGIKKWAYLLQYCGDSNEPSTKMDRFIPHLHWYRPGWKQFALNRTLQCVTACPILSPQWSGIKKWAYLLQYLRRFEWAKHQHWPFQPLSTIIPCRLKAICFNSASTMRNSMSNFKSPMIRNQKMSISLAVLRRFEWAKHQNGPFQPRLHWYRPGWKQFASNRTLQCVTACPILSPQWSGIKKWAILSPQWSGIKIMSISLAVLRRFEWAKHQHGPFQPFLHWYHAGWKQFALIRTLQCVTACPILSPQWSGIKKWACLLQYCGDSNEPSTKMDRFNLLYIDTVQVESNSLQIGLYNA